jgi:hypothetical protein
LDDHNSYPSFDKRRYHGTMITMLAENNYQLLICRAGSDGRCNTI